MQQVADPFIDFLKGLVGSSAKNYLWLRFLSYLEYIGYRKMVKALDYQEVHKGVFHHLTDEIQHSFMLRELAEKAYGSIDGFAFETQIKKIAEDYFQGIDGEIDRWVANLVGRQDPYRCYIFVSYIIEKRAMRVYPQYFNCLLDAPSKYVIQKIIRDESEHLSYLKDKLETMPEFQSFTDANLADREDEYFGTMIQEIRKCMSLAEANAA